MPTRGAEDTRDRICMAAAAVFVLFLVPMAYVWVRGMFSHCEVLNGS